ncbi:hypothetical protein [Sulfurovum sp.]|uniref:hypothetical protein n=1 Tax=Sulfurovum sp. TaxID=1969726 RepID=UPI0025FD8417|nr:hypothetical protein [Sulfurovum sp.]
MFVVIQRKVMMRTFGTAIKFAMKPAMWKRKKYLLLLGHMRSYSTLFSHLLGSHKAICGNAQAYTG